MKNKSKIELSFKEKQLLILLAAVVILFSVYQFVFVPCQRKIEQNSERIEALASSIDRLDSLSIHEKKYTDEIKEYETKTKEIKSAFIQDIKQEDIVYFIRDMEKYSGTYVKNITFYDKALVTPSAKEVGEEVVEQVETTTDNRFVIEGYNSMVDVHFTCSYEELKQMVDYINQYKSYRSINHIRVAYDMETGLLDGMVTINIYSMPSSDKKRETIPVEVDKRGSHNIFDTLE